MTEALWTAQTDTAALVAAIERFERDLPGWWYSLGTCSISRDASCGPEMTACDRHLLAHAPFNQGFHADLDGTMADALDDVREQALKADAEHMGKDRPHD